MFTALQVLVEGGKSLIEENSGSIVSSITKKLDYLIIGEKPTNRKWNKKNSYKNINSRRLASFTKLV